MMGSRENVPTMESSSTNEPNHRTGSSGPRRRRNHKRNLDKNCRLRNDLNPDCLAAIFESLDVMDLLTLSRMNSHYKHIINKYVVPKKQFNFSELIILKADVFRDVFSAFGKRMENIKYTGCLREFSKILDEVKEFCGEDQFRHVELDFSRLIRGNWDPFCVRNTSKYFRKLESFSFYGDFSLNEKYNQFMVAVVPLMLEKTEKLLSLKIGGVYLRKTSNIFGWRGLKHLTELHLINVTVHMECLLDYFRTKPNLQTFVNINSIFHREIPKVGEVLAEHCGDTIEKFVDVKDHIAEMDCESEEFFMRYSFISKFPNLKEVMLTSRRKCGSDLYYPIVALAANNTIEKLGVHQCGPHFSWMYPEWFELERQFLIEGAQLKIPNEFTNLKSLEFSINQCWVDNLDNQPLEFFMNNSKEILRNVETLTLTGDDEFIFPSSLVQIIPNLQKLSIRKEVLFSVNQVISDVSKILEKRRKGARWNDFIEINVNTNRIPDFEHFDGVIDENIKLGSNRD